MSPVGTFEHNKLKFLESRTLRKGSRYSGRDQSRKIQTSLKNVRRLKLRVFVTEQLLTPEVLKLFRWRHPEFFKKYVTPISFSDLDCSNDLVRRLSEIRGTDRKVRSLDLKRMLSHEGQLELLGVSAADLQELRLLSRHLPSGAHDIGVVSKCKELRRLSLEGDLSFEESHLKRILSNNSELEALELVLHRPLAENSLALIHNLKRLKKLSLNSHRDLFDDSFLCSLGNMSKLRHLELSSPIDNLEVWRNLARLPNLRSVKVTSLTSESFDVLFGSLKNLEALDLGDASRLTDADMTRLGNLKRLKSLEFTRGVRLTDLTFEKGVGSAAMEVLEVSCASLRETGLASIAAHHGSLKTIALDVCNKVSNSAMLNSLRGEPRLRELKFRAGPLAVLGDTFDELTSQCSRLEVIRFFPESE